MARRLGVELTLGRLRGAGPRDAADGQHPAVGQVPDGGLLLRRRPARAAQGAGRPARHLRAAPSTGPRSARTSPGAKVFNEDVIRTRGDPIVENNTLAVLRGNLAPDGAVIKPAAAEERLHRHTGPAVVFENYDDMAARIDDPDLDIDENSVIVLRSAGPAGCAGDARVGAAADPEEDPREGDPGHGADLRRADVAAPATAPACCTWRPRRHVGGPLALVRTGDLIELDVPARRSTCKVTDEELEKRRADWQQPPREVRPRLRRAVPAAHHPGQRGLRLRLPGGRPAGPGAGDPLMVPGSPGKRPSGDDVGVRDRDDDHRRGARGRRRPGPSTRSPRRGTAASSAPSRGPGPPTATRPSPPRSPGAAVWRRTPAHERLRILLRAADLADERTPRSPRLISAENGKTIREATVEASRCGDVIRLSAFEGAHLYGETLPLDAAPGTGFDKIGFTVRQPCGVVLAITPFNYPACSPSTRSRRRSPRATPWCSSRPSSPRSPRWRWPTASSRPGCPSGVLSVVTGPAARSATCWWPTRACGRCRSPGRPASGSASPARPG